MTASAWNGLPNAPVCRWPILLQLSETASTLLSVISFDYPTSMPDNPDQFEMAMQLKGRVQEVGARFLLTELEAGLALLDVADTSQSGSSNERRRALALEAYEVVTDRLARIGADAIPLPDDEQETIQRLYQELRTRLGR